LNEIRALETVLEQALRRGGDFAEVYVEQRRTQALSHEADRLERATAGLERGAGIRVVQGDTSAYAFTNDLTEEGLLAAAAAAAAAARAGRAGRVVLPLVAREAAFVPELRRQRDEAPLADQAAVVERANRVARAVDRRVRQVTVNYRELDQEVTIVNSLGFRAEDRRVRTVVAVNAVAADGGIIQTGYDSRDVPGGPEGFDRDLPERLAETAARRAVRMLSARPAPTGRMPVVVAAKAGGTMIHEACGHGLEADLVQKGLSVYASRQGEQVASELVTVIDDATLPGRYGSARFDDEGVPCRRNVLIERGVLQQYLHSLITARQAKVEPNGCGRRESYRHVPIPRMSNTFIAPGTDDPARIVADTARGLYVTRMGGGQVNTANGDFVFEVAEGYLIEGGEIGPPVRGATLTGNGPAVLRLVDRVGSDQGFTIGTCGKDGQGVAVTDAQPTLRIPELIVGGTAHEPEGEESL
jgi:TldD protein